MSASVIDLCSYLGGSSFAPTLVLIDMQQEHLSSDRVLAIPEMTPALANCRAALAHARSMNFPVAFVRSKGQSSFFRGCGRNTRWIEGFEPKGADMVFERDRPSCYASTHFDEAVTLSGGNLVLAGFAGEAACLSTAIEAYHRGHRFTYLADASTSRALDEMPAQSVHAAITRIIGLYDDVLETQAWITATTRSAQRRGILA